MLSASNTLGLALLAVLGQAPSAATATPVERGQDTPRLQKTRHAAPSYPEAARRAGIAGQVLVECTVDQEGKVVDARVQRGLPLLDEAALEAVRKWRFSPASVDPAPGTTPVQVTARVNFEPERVEVRELVSSLAHEDAVVRAMVASNLGWVARGRIASKSEVRDAIAALEKAAASDAAPEVRSAAQRALSRIDGRPVAGELPGDPVPSPLELTSLGVSSRSVAWGAFVDPTDECEAEARGDRVEIGIPRGLYDLSVERERVEAPRLMQAVEGDLTAQVTVDELPHPSAAKFGPTSRPFRAGGLLLWQDEWNYVRLEAAVYLGLGDGLVRFALFEIRNDGKLYGRPASPDVRLGPGATDLRLAVRGGEILAEARQGAGPWRRVGRAVVEPPPWVGIGVAAINSSTAPLRAGFSGFELIRGSIVEEPADAGASDASTAPAGDSPPKRCAWCGPRTRGTPSFGRSRERW